MNHCVVFRQVGATPGAVYPGPPGAVLTPAFVGLPERASSCTPAP